VGDRRSPRSSVQLAFLAAVQILPPRQRAVLILRHVLGWSAAEVANVLDATTASVTNALHRAGDDGAAARRGPTAVEPHRANRRGRAITRAALRRGLASV